MWRLRPGLSDARGRRPRGPDLLPLPGHDRLRLALRRRAALGADVRRDLPVARRRWLAASVIAALAGATRPSGLTLVVACAVVAYSRGARRSRPAHARVRRRRPRWPRAGSSLFLAWLGTTPATQRSGSTSSATVRRRHAVEAAADDDRRHLPRRPRIRTAHGGAVPRYRGGAARASVSPRASRSGRSRSPCWRCTSRSPRTSRPYRPVSSSRLFRHSPRSVSVCATTGCCSGV